MIGWFIDRVEAALLWIVGVLDDISYFFARVAYYAQQLPTVGNYLYGYFTSIKDAFSDMANDFVHFTSRTVDVLNAIDNWLDELADLVNDVYGWIMDRIDDAYAWADDALTWIVEVGQDLWRDVYGWIMDRIDDAYNAASDALTWVAYTGMDLYRDVYGWITDNLTDAYNWASDAWDWIVDNAPDLENIPQLVQDAVLQFIGPAFNLIETWFEDINLFFSDPPAYFSKKIDDLGSPFADALFKIFEKILEKIW